MGRRTDGDVSGFLDGIADRGNARLVAFYRAPPAGLVRHCCWRRCSSAIVLFPYVVITVPSGQVGVLWKRFNGYDLYCWCFVGRGTILDPRELRDEGLHIIWPWDKLFLYNLRLQSATQTYNAITKDGVNVSAQINIRFQLLHNYVGGAAQVHRPAISCNRSSSPEIGSRAREVIAQYTAQEVYTSREQIQQKIRAEAQKSLGAHLNSLVQPEAMEQPDPKHYNDFLQNSIQILDTLVLEHRIAAGDRRGHQPADPAILSRSRNTSTASSARRRNRRASRSRRTASRPSSGR